MLKETKEKFFYLSGGKVSPVSDQPACLRKTKGIEYADSVSWSLHKRIGIPLSCTVLLTKQNEVLRKAFVENAQ